jgi:hypothetical protein
LHCFALGELGCGLKLQGGLSSARPVFKATDPTWPVQPQLRHYLQGRLVGCRPLWAFSPAVSSCIRNFFRPPPDLSTPTPSLQLRSALPSRNAMSLAPYSIDYLFSSITYKEWMRPLSAARSWFPCACSCSFLAVSPSVTSPSIRGRRMGRPSLSALPLALLSAKAFEKTAAAVAGRRHSKSSTLQNIPVQ